MTWLNGGNLLRGVLAAEPRPGGRSDAQLSGAIIFVDTRLLGQRPTFIYRTAGWHSLVELVRFLGFQVPANHHIRAYGVACRDEWFNATHQCTVQLYVEPDNNRPGFQSSLASPAGPPPPLPVRLVSAADRQESGQNEAPMLTAQVRLCKVGHQTTYHTLPIRTDCTEAEIADAVRSLVDEDEPLQYDRLVVLTAQPDNAYITCLLAPDWTRYVALSLLCLHSTKTVPQGHETFFAALVPLPVFHNTICEAAGLSDPSSIRLYLDGCPDRLLSHDEVRLPCEGLITIGPSDGGPPRTIPLSRQPRVGVPGMTDATLTVDRTLSNHVLLLQGTASVIYRVTDRAPIAHTDAARALGVRRQDVEFHTPSTTHFAGLQHQGVKIREVVAVVPARREPYYVLFLDLRPLAQEVTFTVLCNPYISIAALTSFVRRSPPPSWRLRVVGGRRRRGRIDFHNHGVLVLGFQYTEPDSDEASRHADHDSTSDSSSDDSGGEEGPDSGSSHEGSTRSRSPRSGRRDAREVHSPTTDHSYQGGPEDQICAAAATQLSATDPSQPTPVEGSGGGPAIIGCSGGLHEPTALISGTADQTHGPPAHAPTDFRLTEAGRQGTPSPHTALGLVLPDEQPHHVEEVGFHILMPEYRSETCSLDLTIPCELDEALHALTLARSTEVASFFDCLLPADPQPDATFATVLAIPAWAGARQIALVDSRDVDGRLFAYDFPQRLSRESILLQLHLSLDDDLQLFSGTTPVEPGETHEFQQGETLTISWRGARRPTARPTRGPPQGWFGMGIATPLV